MWQMWVVSVMSKKSKHSIVDFGNLREACLLTENSKEGFSVTIVEILFVFFIGKLRTKMLQGCNVVY